ncbi:MAG: DUF1517 domain-containing protein [Leptolyngbyaceae cyanobacterium SL_7_1]|nr:DUF1517 domain-containing protein [Leptolyngbyaceae cyanobacterium SL_7_1]
MMQAPVRSPNQHARNRLLLINLLVALSCLGFFIEMKNEKAREAQIQALQNSQAPGDAALGLSGGRSRGGTFDAPSAPSGSSGGSIPRSAPGYDSFPDYGGGYYPRDYGGGYYPRYPSYPRGGTVVIPYPGGYAPTYPAPGGVSTGGGFFFLLLVLGFTVLPLVINLLKLRGVQSAHRAPSRSGGAGEMLNDVITVTQLQVALLAQARTIQADLTELTTHADLQSQQGLSRMLQETVLALLRSPENWSHARRLLKPCAVGHKLPNCLNNSPLQNAANFHGKRW